MNKFEFHQVEDVVFVTLDKVPNEPKIIADIFTEVAKEEINLDMISQTAPYKDKISLFFTVGQNDLAKMLKAVGELKSKISELETAINPGNCKMVLFGECLKTEWGIAARLFTLLAKHNIKITLITTSDVEIELLFDSSCDFRFIKNLLIGEFVNQ